MRGAAAVRAVAGAAVAGQELPAPLVSGDGAGRVHPPLSRRHGGRGGGRRGGLLRGGGEKPPLLAQQPAPAAVQAAPIVRARRWLEVQRG